ncbi:hypothetical protein LJC33_05395 [Eubacteriales bacterium OttesenSCG-928-N13]|nr:hypothetical protein [Eubacteriales bacterium OttesenSCG-928-N13]
MQLFGFDLGDGESAVAWAKRGSRNEPQLLEIAGRKSVLTALGEHPQMGILIGEQAFLADAERLHLRFKSKFLTDPDASEPLIRAFAEAVKRELMKTDKLIDPNDAAFFVGCPSGWTDQQREDYQRLFEQAGFKHVTIVSESRAAFMFVRESGELNLSDHALAKPVLIIDAGSSTTDFTFINQLHTVRAFDFGETALGGGLIDQMLLEKNLDRSPNAERIKDVLGRYPQYRARAELEARKLKEMHFIRATQLGSARFALPSESSVKIYAEKPPLTLDLSCTDEDMDQILNQPIAELGGQSYLDSYRRCLLNAKAQLADTLPELMLLTGGASRMGFIAEIAREVFPNATLHRGAEPEFSIARGLCYALRVDLKTAEFEAEVKALIDSSEVEDIITRTLPKLFYDIAPIIADDLIENSAPDAFQLWKSGAIKTLDEMSDSIKMTLSDSIKEGEIHERLTATMCNWVERIRPEIEILTDPITEKYELPLTSLRLPSALEVDAMQLDLPTSGLMNFNFIQTMVDVTVGAIVAMLLGGGGMALLMAGPIGLILSFAIGFVASRLGTDYAKKHLDKLDMPAFMRILFTKGAFKRHLEGQRDKLEQAFADQMIALIDPRSEQIDQLIAQVSGAIEGQLGQLAEQARLLMH